MTLLFVGQFCRLVSAQHTAQRLHTDPLVLGVRPTPTNGVTVSEDSIINQVCDACGGQGHTRRNACQRRYASYYPKFTIFLGC